MERTRPQFLLCCAKFLLVLLTSPVVAQSPTPLPVPNVPVGVQGTISAMASQPDGGVILGGRFTMIDGIPRRNLARLQPDGTLDPDWNPSADGEVLALVANAAGDVYAGGYFKVVDGHPRAYAAKLSGTGRGAVDAQWNPGFGTEDISDGNVRALALDADGSLFAGGDFISVGGLPRYVLAKLDASNAGAVDPLWAPSVDAFVTALAVDSRGSLYVGRLPPDGGFPGGGYCYVLCIRKFSTSGTGEEAADWNPQSIIGIPTTLVVDADGSLYAGGSFWTETEAYHTLVRFPNGHGEIDDGWTSPIAGPVSSLLADGGGGLYVGRDLGVSHLSLTPSGAVVNWTSRTVKYPAALAIGTGGDLYSAVGSNSFDNWPIYGLARVSSADGFTKTTVEVQSPGLVNAVAHQPDGGLIVGGSFSRAAQSVRQNIFRIQPDGDIDPDWLPSISGSVMELAVDADNGVYVRTSGAETDSLIKLAGNGSGQRDPLWTNPFPRAQIYAIALDERRGTLVIGGQLFGVEGPPRQNIARLSMTDGSWDRTWSPPANDSVGAIAVDRSGTAYYIVEPDLTPLNTNRVTKLSSSSGAVDSSWQPPTITNSIYAVAVAPDDTIYIGGARYVPDPVDGTSPRWSVEKISPNGLVLQRWGIPGSAGVVRGYVNALAADGRGAIYAGGWLSGRGYLAKFSDSSDTPSEWSPVVEGGAVLALDTDGKSHLYVGGQFETINGQPRIGLAALPIPADPVRPPSHGQRPLPPVVRERPRRADNVLPLSRASER